MAASSRWTIRSGCAGLPATWGSTCRSATVSVIDAVPATFRDALPVLPVRLAVPARPGQPDARTPPPWSASIERATELAVRGAAGAVVTNPINKAALYDAGFAYPGHTEFLAALTGAVGKQIMMLAQPAAARGAGDRARLAARSIAMIDDRDDRRGRTHHARRRCAAISASLGRGWRLPG